jgi:hypothetical protein
MNERDSANEMDAALDARLRAAFAPPRDVQRMAREVLAQSGVARPVSRWRHLRSVAAILFVAAGLGWLASRDVSTPPALVAMDAGQLHAQIAAGLGEPMSCNSPEEESSQLVTQGVGTQLDYRGGTRVPLQGPLALPADWPGDPAATVLAGHFEGRVVVVVIESVELTRGSGFDPTEELLVHRRELGGYILYEISSGEAPVCLDEFSLRYIR